jgi:hypothetical protein
MNLILIQVEKETIANEVCISMSNQTIMLHLSHVYTTVTRELVADKST